MASPVPRPLAEIVQWLLQQHQQQRSAHSCHNNTPAAPLLLPAEESLRDRWRNDSATLGCLRELTTLDLSACEICSFDNCREDQFEERWASDKLSILLDCMPQLTSLDLRNSQQIERQFYKERQLYEERYRDEICDEGLLEAIGKLTSLQVLRVGAVGEPKGWAHGLARDQCPDHRAAAREGLAVLAGALKSLTRLTELKLTVGKSLHAFEEGCEELFGAIAALPALLILHMPVRRIGDIKAHSPAVARSLAGTLSGLKMLADLNLQRHKFCLTGATSLVNALQSLPGLTHLRMGALEELPAELGVMTGLQTIGLSRCQSLEKLPAVLGALTRLKEIDLSYCGVLKELPAELGALKELQKINLSGCKSLKKLPAWVIALSELREMDLKYCGSLKKLPAGIGGLTALREIDLSGCSSLKELPAELGALKELQKINLLGCRSLEKLPDWVSALSELREMDLSGCSSLKELPAELGALKELQKINLRHCRSLQKLPSVFGGLVKLREINFSHCYSLKELPAELCVLTQLKDIILEGCYALHTPPPHVVRQGTEAVLQFLRDLAKGELQMQKINLSGCHSWEKLPDWVSGLTALREIDLSHCFSLKELPAELGALKDLQKINLSGCKSLEKLPDWVGDLSELREMDLSGCSSLKELPEELGALKELETINLRDCKSLEKFSCGIGGLTALREMDLSGCSSLNDLTAELGALKELEKINLSGCKSLEKLPAGIGGLTALREMDLSGCSSLNELTAVELGALKELEKINLSGCKSLEKLPAGIGGLTALREMDLSGCSSLNELTAELGALKELQKINLSGCKSLEKLPDCFSALSELREMDLSGCSSLKELPAELGALTQLGDVELEGCYALHTPPPHVVRQGTGAVLEFLRDLAKGDAPCHLIKVVLLGNQRAGKSSLADSLVLGRPVTRADSDRTVGIEVRRWPVGRKSQLVVNIYDAAGHRVYRATHGLFMSAGALFLHVVRSDMPEDDAVETLLEWVEVVQQEAPGAVMGVVWTHLDCALVSKSRVLGRVHEEMNEKMRALDDAMREIEDVITDHLQDRGAEQGWGLCEKWMRAREQRYAALKALDQRAMAGCTAEDEVVEQLIERLQHEMQVLEDVVAHQHEMEVLEDQLSMPQSVGNGEPSGEQLKRLRHKRLHRPRMHFSYSVSSRTGEGLDELRHALTALMENQRPRHYFPLLRYHLLFPHVGAKVPLNYSMLERLAQEGRTQASGGTEADSRSDADRAAWEMAVTKHVKERASDGLRDVCKKPYLRLGELEEEASKVGMDKDEVLRALKFLHAAGSVLYYGTDTHRSSPELKNTVFMQPQFIIDAISYVIREPRADHVNDEVRKNDERIRETSADCREALNKYLGCEAGYGCTEGHGSGVLPKWLLTRHLWRDINPNDHRVLMQLMMAFKLLRPLAMSCERSQPGVSQWLTQRATQKYLVPVMLPKSELPLEYTTPQWWCPSTARSAAVMLEDRKTRAEMRIVYEVLGGSFPFGFMSALQVSLVTLAHSKSVEEELTSASETAVVDRMCGTVLSEAYECGGGQSREWIILSRPPSLRTGHNQASGVMTEPVTDSIRIMGWIELYSAEGATDWRLCTRVMREIQKIEQRYPALLLRKKTFYVDAHGKLSNALEIPRQDLPRLRFTFEDGGQKRQTEVKRERVLPSGSWKDLQEYKLVQQQSCESEGTVNRVEAFFAKQTHDHKIDVHGEAQLLMRCFVDPGCGWECRVNPQPTIQDLISSIKLAKQRNTRVLHLAGHCTKELGFEWNATDAATESKTFDVEVVSALIGTVAGQQGPIECVVLNACCTENMGRMLLRDGVPNVVCWRTLVHDETARDTFGHFYHALGNDRQHKRDYTGAFAAAMNAMRPLSHRHGAEDLPHTVAASVSVDARGGKRGIVEKWQIEDVVLFLSHDRESDCNINSPVFLWRDRTRSVADVSSSSAPADVVCLLSKDGDEFLDTDHIRGRVGDDAGDDLGQRLEGAEAKHPRSPEDQEDLRRRICEGSA